MFHKPYDDVAKLILQSPEMELLRSIAWSPEARLIREMAKQSMPIFEMTKHCAEVNRIARVGASIFRNEPIAFDRARRAT